MLQLYIQYYKLNNKNWSSSYFNSSKFHDQ